jgi:hypothetical protein
MCSSYYDYAGAYDATLPGRSGSKAASYIRNSGRTISITKTNAWWYRQRRHRGHIVPEIAKDAAHVTMLQRSPTYVVSIPAEDALANWLRARLPAVFSYQIVRWRNILLQMYLYNRARKVPTKVKAYILKLIRNELGLDYDLENFTPRYNP